MGDALKVAGRSRKMRAMVSLQSRRLRMSSVAARIAILVLGLFLKPD